MKILLIVCCLALGASAAVLPAKQRLQRRDVSELQQSPGYQYLPPTEKLALPEPVEAEVATTTVEIITEAPETTTAAAAPSAALSDNGYEYRTVRLQKYRYRTQRDVSHLAQHYLPPAESISNEYLPPIVAEEQQTQADTEEVVAAEEQAASVAPDVSNVYLPPQEDVAPVEDVEIAEKQVASTEAAATAVEAETEATLEVETETEAAPAAAEEKSQDTAVFAEDGYHYKQPAELPQEFMDALEDDAVAVVPNDYLPPLQPQVLEAEGPEEETAVLADDGYHYRVIRRIQF